MSIPWTWLGPVDGDVHQADRHLTLQKKPSSSRKLAHLAGGPGDVPGVRLEVGVQLQHAAGQRGQVGGGQAGRLAHGAQYAAERGQKVLRDRGAGRRHVPAANARQSKMRQMLPIGTLTRRASATAYIARQCAYTARKRRRGIRIARSAVSHAPSTTGCLR